MEMSMLLNEAPVKIQVGGVVYSRSDQWCAIRLAQDTTPPADARFVLENDGIAVVPITSAVESAENPGPVYQLAPGGSPAVPTGRVFVRLQEGRSASERQRDFAQAGYAVEHIPAWAPHTAWLSAAAGGIVTALNGIDCLRSLAGVEHVEPQLLRPRAARKR
jgi:hypothetical protein